MSGRRPRTRKLGRSSASKPTCQVKVAFRNGHHRSSADRAFGRESDARSNSVRYRLDTLRRDCSADQMSVTAAHRRILRRNTPRTHFYDAMLRLSPHSKADVLQRCRWRSSRSCEMRIKMPGTALADLIGCQDTASLSVRMKLKRCSRRPAAVGGVMQLPQ